MSHAQHCAHPGTEQGCMVSPSTALQHCLKPWGSVGCIQMLCSPQHGPGPNTHRQSRAVPGQHHHAPGAMFPLFTFTSHCSLGKSILSHPHPTTSTQGPAPGQSSFQPFAPRCLPWGNLLFHLLLLSGVGPDAASSPGCGRDIPTIGLRLSQTGSMERGQCCPCSPLHHPRADLN